MKYFLDSTQLKFRVAAGSFVIATAMITPQAFAHSVTDRVKELENQLRAIQNQLNQLKSESVQEAQKVQRIEKTVTEKVQQIEETVTENRQSFSPGMGQTEKKNHRVFFRGGWARANETHNGVSIESRVAPVGAQERGDRDAWYIGAGLDFSITDNVWGLMPKTELLAEVMFEYKNFRTGVLGNALANEPTQLAGGALNPRGVTVSQFTLTAAPKIKFMEGSKFRPWIIPAGLAIHVISPPSESITVLDPGVMFGGGIEYNLWKDIYIGADARYHLTVGTVDGAKIDGLTTGGYLSMGF